MRTTLTIDDDVLAAARSMAQQRGASIGEVVSDLARRALERPSASAAPSGFPLLPNRGSGRPVTLEMVNALRDEAP